MRRASRPRKSSQGFRTIDGLIAIAVTAFGFAWALDGWAETLRSIPNWSWTRRPNPNFWFGDDPFYSSARNLIVTMIQVGATLAAPWGVALVILRRVRHPRSPFWRARRPGAVASLASSVVLVLVLTWQAIAPSWVNFTLLIGPPDEVRAASSYSTYDIIDLYGFFRSGEPFLNTALRLPRLVGFVVGGAWLALGLAGRWRAERSWIDRAGRVLGVFWIIAAIHFLFLPL